MFITLIKEGSFSSEIRVLRDDVYPFLGGGNKGRKMDYIGRDILAKKANAIVTTGGIQSNHCRAAAVFAALHSLKCTLVLHGSQKQFLQQEGNARVMRDTGAKLDFVLTPDEIGSAMNDAVAAYKEGGDAAYYIYGGGHTMEGGLAYIDAVGDLKKYCDRNMWWPDFIFHASGTGSTQAGILAGLDRFELETEVVGISVGRKKDAAEKVVTDFYHQLCLFYDIPLSRRRVTVLDDYLCGGYGLFNDEVKIISKNSLRNYGLILDTTYTAKAFYGMLEYVRQHHLQDKKILFWHTGGVFNYLAE